MNINAQELMLVRRNMVFGESKPTEQTASPTTEPISKPDNGMKALEIQANNNIAFQGVKQNMMNKLGRKVTPFIMAAGMAAATLTLPTSCIETNAWVNIDETVLSDIKALLQSNNDLLTQILLEQKVGNEIQEKALEIQEKNSKTLEEMAVVQKLDYEESKKISNALTQGIADIIEQLKADGATDKEILAALNAFNGNVDKYLQEFLINGGSFGELLEKIEQAVQDAVKVLNAILNEFQGLRADINKNAEDLNLTMLDQTTILKMIFLEEQDQTALLDSMNNNQKGMAENLEILKEDNKNLAKFVVENGDKVLNYLASLDKNSAEFVEEVEKWSLLGIDIRAILEKHSVNTDEGMKALKEAVENNGKKLDKLTELVDIHFADANAKLAFIAKYLPELKNDSNLQAEIEKLTQIIEENTDALNKNSEITEEGVNEMKGVNAKLDKILEKMDKLISNTAGLGKYLEDQPANWKNLFTYLTNNGNDLEEIKAGIQTISSYSYILNQKMDQVLKAIEELKNNGNNVGGMTVEEYYNATLELDEINRTNLAKDIKKIIEETVSDKLITVNQWLASIDNKLGVENDLSNQLLAKQQELIDLLKNMDYSNSEQVALLRAIYKDMADICKCGADKNESVPDSDDLENRFN